MSESNLPGVQCPNCGTENEPGAAFCATCGTPLRAGMAPANAALPPSYGSPPPASISVPTARVRTPWWVRIGVLAALLLAVGSLGLSAYLITRPSVSSVCDSAGIWSLAPQTRDLPAGWSLDRTNFFFDSYSYNLSLTGPQGLGGTVRAYCVNGSPQTFLQTLLAQADANSSASEVSMGSVGDESKAYRSGNTDSPGYEVFWRHGAIVVDLSASGTQQTGNTTTPIGVTDIEGLMRAIDQVISR